MPNTATPPVDRPWAQEALELAAQCWCDEETKNIEMDAVLAQAIAKRIEAWMDTAAQNERNTVYYRGLLEECAKSLGPDAYLCDDGTTSEDPLLAKVPELVRKTVS